MKKLFLLVISLTSGILCHGADLMEVRLGLNRADGVYDAGEEAVVTASVEAGFSRPLQMTVLENGVQIVSKDITLSQEPQVIYRRSCGRTLALMVFVKDKDGNSAGIGFVFAPEGFSPGYPCPDDFKAFWDGELAAMRTLPLEAKVEEVPVPGEDSLRFRCFSLEIPMHEGRPVRGYVALPREAAPGTLPVVLFLHGAGVSSKSNRSSVETAVEYARYGGGCIAADINAHGMLNDQPQQYYIDLEDGDLKDYRVLPPKSKREFYYRLMYLRDVRALDWLCTLKEWDGRHVLVTGSSQGGSQTCAVAGLDSRVGAIVSIVTGLSDEGAAMVRQCGWKRHFRGMTDHPDVRAFYPYYDSVNFLRYTSARIRIEVGLIDTTVPPEGVYAAFNSCGAPWKEIVPCPYRRHTMKPSNIGYEEWRKTIGTDRDRFIEEYLRK